MLRIWVIVAAFVPTLVFGLTNPQECLDGSPMPYGVRISGCATAPCTLVLGRTVIIELDFTATSGLTNTARAVVHAESMGMTGIYELSDQQANICLNLPAGQTCPLDAGEAATYFLEFILYDYPIFDFVVEISIEYREETITCFRLPVRTIEC